MSATRQIKERQKLSPEILGILQRARANAKTAQQFFQMTINSVFEQYGLTPQDEINLETGEITKSIPPETKAGK